MYPPANTVNHQAKIRFSKIARTVYILAFRFLSTVHVRVYHDYPTRCLPTSSPRMHFNLPGSTVWVNQLWYSRVWFWALNKVTRLSSIWFELIQALINRLRYFRFQFWFRRDIRSLSSKILTPRCTWHWIFQPVYSSLKPFYYEILDIF